jgi:AI-2 transport protein TqsA
MAAAGGEVDPVMPNDPSGEGPGTTLVPRWVSGNTNLFATLVACVMVGLALFLIGWLAPVVAPMGLGLFLAALAAPMFTWLEQRGRSPALALTLTIAVVLAIGVGLVSLVLAGAAALTDGIVTYADDLRSRYPDVSDPTVARSVAGMMARILPPDVLSDVLKAVARILVEVGQSLIFAVVVAALVLHDGRRLSSLAARGIGSEGPVFRETPGIARAAVTYFAVRIRINAVTAIGFLVLMLVLGIDDALLWAVAAFFLSFVPYLGLVLAMIPPAILAFAESGVLPATIFVIGGTALNLIAENVLEPTLTGRALSLSTWVVFTMFFFWVWLIGPVGALLSMPITVLVVLVLQHNDRTQWIAALLSRQQPEDVPDLLPAGVAGRSSDADISAE